MKVTLLNYTPNALETLLFTKQTRLNMVPGTWDKIVNMTDEEKMAELDYMLGTIQSSWEFVDYIFCIEGVSRAFTHQLVRHRVGTSFAQQAQRAVDMSGFDYIIGPSIAEDAERYKAYGEAMTGIGDDYAALLELGANKQDARGVLPTNIATNIIFKANLRTLHDMGLKRLCVKAQGEFQDVFREIRKEVVKVHPWASKFIKVWCAFHGTCAFPTYPVEDCPVKPFVYDPDTGKAYDKGQAASKDWIEKFWEENRAEAQP